MNFELDSKTKQIYRDKAKYLKKTLDIAKISDLICEQLKGLDVYKKAEKTAGFYPLKTEIDIKQLYKESSKKWFLPVVADEKNMVFSEYQNHTTLTKNKFGILEPSLENEIKPDDLDLIIVPALMVDMTGHRLGFGKGYYDRFLSTLSKSCIKIAVIPDELLVEKLPADEFDIPVNIVVTQSKIIKI